MESGKKRSLQKKMQERIFKRGSVTYYYSSLFFRGQVKRDVFSLYAYVRQVDDLVDSVPSNNAKLESYWDQTVAAWNGKTTGNPIIDGFVELAKRKQFKLDWVESFWQSMRADLKKTIYKKYTELEEYIYGSAEVIGLMMAQIMDLPPESHAAARMQGKSMQYINMIRDVKEDLEMGRNYLGYSPDQQSNSEKWRKFVRSKIDLYFQMQDKAKAGYYYIPRQYLIPIKTAAGMYLWTAHQIYQNPEIVWQKKVKPSKLRVVAAVLTNSILL